MTNKSLETKRIIFQPTEENRNKLLKVAKDSGVSVSVILNLLLDEMESDTKISIRLEQKQENEPQEPIRNDKCTCPKCGTYNEVIKKRRNTVLNDVVYCWHCGQAISVEQLN